MLVMAEYRLMQEKLLQIIQMSEDVISEIETMENTAENLDIFWDGEANSEYMLNVSAGLLNARLLIQKVMRCGNFLSYALSRYQSSERRISEMIEQIY